MMAVLIDKKAIYDFISSMRISNEAYEKLSIFIEGLEETEIIHCEDCERNDGMGYCKLHYRHTRPLDFCIWGIKRRSN